MGFDFKLLVVPAVLLLSSQFNMTDLSFGKTLQSMTIALAVLLYTLHFVVLTKISTKKDETKIWVPPKGKPQAASFFSPPIDPPEPSEYKETTYYEHEFKVLKDSAGTLTMSLIVAFIMSYRFRFHMALLIQVIQLPLIMVDEPCFQKYLMGGKSAGNRPYNEEHSAPTKEMINKRFNITETPQVTIDDKASTTNQEVVVKENKNESNNGVNIPSTPLNLERLAK